jgi:hypothetical protein
MLTFKSDHVSRYTFAPKWKEELICKTIDGSFLIEMTMGITCVYAPTKETWEKNAPDWDKSNYDLFISELEEYCKKQGFPLRQDPSAWIEKCTDR